VDGGRTWTRVLNPGNAGSFVVVTPDEVWQAGGVNDDSLYVTRDGAKSWHTVSLPAPKEAAPASIATYDLPIFLDSQHGFEAVTYGVVPRAQAVAVLFKTDDGGSTWNPDRILTDLGETSMGDKVASASANSTWIIVKSGNPEDTPPVITKLGANARVS